MRIRRARDHEELDRRTWNRCDRALSHLCLPSQTPYPRGVMPHPAGPTTNCKTVTRIFVLGGSGCLTDEDAWRPTTGKHLRFVGRVSALTKRFFRYCVGRCSAPVI